MPKRYLVLAVICATVFAGGALPAFAQDWTSVGGGYWTLPNYAGKEGEEEVAVGTEGIFASLAAYSNQAYFEIDYAIEEPNFFALAFDYLYPMGKETRRGGESAYLGMGYTYFYCKDVGNESGINVMIAADMGDELFAALRYDFLGSDKELFTVGLTYKF